MSLMRATSITCAFGRDRPWSRLFLGGNERSYIKRGTLVILCTWVSGPTPSNGPPSPSCLVVGGGGEYVIYVLCTGGVWHHSKKKFWVGEVVFSDPDSLNSDPQNQFNLDPDVLSVSWMIRFLRCSPFDEYMVWKRWVDNKSSQGTQRMNELVKTLLLRRTKVPTA